MFINNRMDKNLKYIQILDILHIMEYYTAVRMNIPKLTQQIWMNLLKNNVGQKMPDTKEYILEWFHLYEVEYQ